MLKHNDFYELLHEAGLIAPIWKYEIELMQDLLDDNNKDNYLSLFYIYFSLVDLGNICMSLDEKRLKVKWMRIVDEAKNVYQSNNNEINNNLFDSIAKASSKIIRQDILDGVRRLDRLVGNQRAFIIDDNYLYIKKYDYARKNIIDSINRLFINNSFNNKSKDDIDKWLDMACDKSRIELSDGQREVLYQGVNKNILVTGGPGTGKTTSIIFILLNLLSENSDYNIYLAAASGKAASRMKESILKGLSLISDEYKKQYEKAYSRLNGVVSNDESTYEEFTIHRLLKIDLSTNRFTYNKNKQFNNNSIFIIDEASMIDISLFNSLLEAIPSNARVFILGDKNQLPAVGAGAVFADMLRLQALIDNKQVIEIKKSQRFSEDTEVYKVSEEINSGSLIINEAELNDTKNFSFFDESLRETCPIKYYLLDNESKIQKDQIAFILTKWVKGFYNDILDKCIDIGVDSNFDDIYSFIDNCKILSAENDSVRGVNEINSFIRKQIYNSRTVTEKLLETATGGYYAGEILMIIKNNRSLDLYNGDSGILVSFENDKSLYFMIKKKTKLLSKDGKRDDEIFKLGDYVFYPIRMISVSEVHLAYAITIHKSQGSDFNNVLITLPTAIGHPLQNRQILYTAITRTKGFTYILSNKESLEYSSKNVLLRDTNIN